MLQLFISLLRLNLCSAYRYINILITMEEFN